MVFNSILKGVGLAIGALFVFGVIVFAGLIWFAMVFCDANPYLCV